MLRWIHGFFIFGIILKTRRLIKFTNYHILGTVVKINKSCLGEIKKPTIKNKKTKNICSRIYFVTFRAIIKLAMSLRQQYIFKCLDKIIITIWEHITIIKCKLRYICRFIKLVIRYRSWNGPIDVIYQTIHEKFANLHSS